MLYKGKYLIGISKGERVVGVFDNVHQMAKELKANKESLKAQIARLRRGYAQSIGGFGVFFIDVYEKHDDIFTYEDEVFLDFMAGNKTEIPKEIEREH